MGIEWDSAKKMRRPPARCRAAHASAPKLPSGESTAETGRNSWRGKPLGDGEYWDLYGGFHFNGGTPKMVYNGKSHESWMKTRGAPMTRKPPYRKCTGNIWGYDDHMMVGKSHG